MYPIDPNRPLFLIVSDLAGRSEHNVELDLDRSVVRASLEKEPLSCPFAETRFLDDFGSWSHDR